MLGGLSAGVAARSPSKRSRSPGVVAQSPAKRLKQHRVFSNPSVALNVTTIFKHRNTALIYPAFST